MVEKTRPLKSIFSYAKKAFWLFYEFESSCCQRAVLRDFLRCARYEKNAHCVQKPNTIFFGLSSSNIWEVWPVMHLFFSPFKSEDNLKIVCHIDPHQGNNAPLRTVFENHRKSLIQHCERSELRLHFEWTKVY